MGTKTLPTAFQSALATHVAALQRIDGVEVVIWRDNFSTPVVAVQARSMYQIDDGQAVGVEYTDIDYLYVPGDYAFDGAPAEPLPGDQVRLPDGRVYQAMIYQGQQCYTLTRDALLRVHYKRISP
jgi:hypothetical protein